MPLNIDINVQDCETLTLEIIDAPVSPSGTIDDDAGLGDTYVTWSADKSSRELADKVDKVAGMGLSELSFTAADKNSLDQSEQDRHTHANKSVIDDLSGNSGALEYRGLPVSDQAALDSKVDKVAGYSLVADDEIAKLSSVEQDAQKNTVLSVAGRQGDVLLDKYDVGLSAVDNTSDADKPVSTAVADALTNKVDKAAGKGLSDENYTLVEKNKLAGVAVEATKNRADSENADKVHTHVISDVTGLSTHLSDTDTLIRRYILSTPFTPYHLFIDKEKGFWADPSDTFALFQNSDGTIAVVDGDPIGLVLDKTGNNYDLKQTVSASRPKLLNGGIVFDRVDDALTLTVPAGGITGTLFLATTRGTASYGVSMPAGVWTIGSAYNPLGNVVSAVLVDRVLTEDEKARLHVFGIGKGGTEFGVETSFFNALRGWTHLVDLPLIDTSSGTNFSDAWYFCSGLTSFPVLDVSSGTNFRNAWRSCSGLTSFPLLDVSSGTIFQSAWNFCSGLTSFPILDVSSGTAFQSTWNFCSGLTSFPLLDVSRGTSFSEAWRSCSGLTSFPANFFDNCLATNFALAFDSTNLSQASIDGILVSINSNSTSNGTFNQSGGSAPSVVGQAAIDAMRARGWTVTTTGGY